MYIYFQTLSLERYFMLVKARVIGFFHLKDNSDNQKSRKIKDLKSKGLEPKIEFLVHGVDDEITIKKIEASIIDLIGKNKLTNIVGGYESSDFGRMDLAQIRKV